MILKNMMRQMALLALEFSPGKVIISLGDQAKIDPAKLAGWVASNASIWTLTPKMKLIKAVKETNWFEIAKSALKELALI